MFRRTPIQDKLLEALLDVTSLMVTDDICKLTIIWRVQFILENI